MGGWEIEMQPWFCFTWTRSCCLVLILIYGTNTKSCFWQLCCFYFFTPISYFPGHQVLSDPHTSYFQDHKSQNGEENKEVNGVAEKEEEEEEPEEDDDDEEDESSDPDIEEEIQASTQQAGPG